MKIQHISAEQFEKYLDKVDVGPLDKNIALKGTKVAEIMEQFQEPVSIYVWLKHKGFLKRSMGKQPTVAIMSDHELDERIESATEKYNVYEIVRDDRFPDEVMQHTECYIHGNISLQEYHKILLGLEKRYSKKKVFTSDFQQEILLILQAYLYQRESISKAVVKKYYQLLRAVCTVYTIGDEWIAQQRQQRVSEEEILAGLKRMSYEKREQICKVINPHTNQWMEVV